MVSEPNLEQQLRAQMRKNITETLISLRVNTVDDIQQITAALAQCMVRQINAAFYTMHSPVCMSTHTCSMNKGFETRCSSQAVPVFCSHTVVSQDEPMCSSDDFMVSSDRKSSSGVCAFSSDLSSCPT